MKIIKNKEIAFIYKDEYISYSKFIDNVIYLSKFLKIQKEDKIVIFMENRPEWIYSFFASWEKKSINVLIDCLASEEEIKSILEDSKPRLIFTSNNTEQILKNVIKELNIVVDIINIDNVNFKETESNEDRTLDYENRKEDVAVILYSSGTTGKAKGIELTFNNLDSNMKDVSKLNIITSGDRMISILQFHHSYPLMVLVLVPLYLNITNVILDKIASEEIFKALQKYKITIIVGVPRLYNLMHKGIMNKIMESPTTFSIFKMMSYIKSSKLKKIVFKKVHEKFGNHIKVLVSGGAKLDPDIANDFYSLGFDLLEGYGLSETSPISAFNTFHNRKVGSVGKPLGDIDIKIQDGEILIKGANVMKGYYNKSEETKEVLKDGWFYTGDLGYIDNGFVHITGRKKEIIVLENGKNISPQEIEDKILKKIGYIKEIGIIGKGTHIHAIILPDLEKLHKDNIININEAIKWEILGKYNTFEPDYKKIYDFTLVSVELPKTRLGKLQRYNLNDFIEMKKIRDIKEQSYDDPEYNLLRKYLEDTTGKEVSIKDHIELDLKLDSIEKVDLQFFLENSFGISISNEDFSRYMVVEDLLHYIKNNKEKLNLENKKNIEELELQLNKEAKLLKIASKILKPMFKKYFKLEIKGLENLPGRNFILASNHESLLDANLIGVSLPYEVLKNTYFLGTDLYFQNPFMKKVAAVANVITLNIDKNLKAVLKQLEYILDKGKNVLIFPEGAITRDGKLGNFKNAFALLSKQLKVPIVPVSIKGAREAYPLGTKIPRPKKICITFSKPIYPEEITYEEISSKTKDSILSNLLKGDIND